MQDRNEAETPVATGKRARWIDSEKEGEEMSRGNFLRKRFDSFERCSIN